MADTIQIYPPVGLYMVGGGTPLILNFKRDTAETWEYGDFLEFNTATGKANKCEAGDSALLGMALSAAPLTVRDDIVDYPVLVFTPELVLEMSCWVNDLSTAANTFAQTDIGGTKHDLAIEGVTGFGYFVFDIGNTTDQIFQLQGCSGRIGGGGIGDIYPRVQVRIITSACQWAI